MKDMSYKLALVTGATSGIGEAMSRLLADKGIHLIITGRSLVALQALQENLRKKVDVQVVPADLSLKEDRQKLVEQIHARSPDLVINNAGYGLYGDALTYNTKEQMEVLEVNVVAVLQLSLEAARTMVSQSLKGTVVNVSSAAAFNIIPALSVYAASKDFVKHFSESFDYEVRSYGVRVLTVCPGGVDTGFIRRAGGEEKKIRSYVKPMTADFVAEEMWRQIQHPEPVRVINWKYHLLSVLSRLIPVKWYARFLHKQILQRIPPRTIIRTYEES